MALRQLKTHPSPVASSEPPDGELVERSRRGEAAAFEKLMRRYNQRVFRAARSVLRNGAEAEDVVQETFVRAYRHLGGFESKASLATWLTRIAVNEALARVRRSRLLDCVSNDSDEDDEALRVESPHAGPEEQVSSRELRTILISAIDSLPESLRTVFVLRDVEGLSTLEACEILELTPEAARVRLHRARAALRVRVEQELGAEVRGLFEFAGARCDRMVTQVLHKLDLSL